jgi:DNA-binding CsgD family transcriptional regulator
VTVNGINMNKALLIKFIDDDKFFVDGLKMLLIQFFKKKGSRIQFLGEKSSQYADIVFQSVELGLPMTYCLQTNLMNGQANFSLRMPGDVRWRSKPTCLRGFGVIFRNESIDDILIQIEHALAMSHLPGTVYCCYGCEKQRLTKRELEVMYYLAREVPPKVIAHILQINVKTVSGHKQMAMKKLNFKRNVELYSWLRLGGLKTVLSH